VRLELPLLVSAEAFFCSQGCSYPATLRFSLRKRSRTPWSEKVLDRCVDSTRPCHCFAWTTLKGSDVMDLRNTTSPVSLCAVSNNSYLSSRVTHFLSSNRLKLSLCLPSTRIEMSPNTKKPPSEVARMVSYDCAMSAQCLRFDCAH
jgi:hypothetical protein